METLRLAALIERLRPAAASEGRGRWLGLFSRDVLGWNLDLFFRQSPRFKRGASVAVVHDVRVTARRLSEYLELAGPVAPAPLTLAGREFLNGFTRILSPIRNADVPRELLQRTLRGDLSAVERDAALELERLLLKRRERKLEDALTFWKRGQTRNRLADMARLRRALSRPSGVLKERFSSVLPGHMEALRATVLLDIEAALTAAFAETAPEDLDSVLHTFRLGVRRLRYACDASRDATGKPLAADVLKLRRVQQVLGEHHDLAVLQKRIAKVKAGLSEKDSRAAGLIRGLDRLAARYARAQQASLRLFRRRVEGNPR